MENVRSFADLRTWKEGHALALEVYTFTKRFPQDERYGLMAQLRSAAVSVPSNIAEGMGRGSAKDLIRFLMHARGSTQEVISQLYLAKDLGYCSSQDFKVLSDRYHGLAAGINSHISSLRPHTI